MPGSGRPDFATFVQVAGLLSSSLDRDTVLRELMGGLDRLLSPSNWSLLLRDEPGETLVFTLVRSQAERELLGRRLEPGEGIAGEVLRSGGTQLIPDTSLDPRFSGRMDELTGFATRSIIAVPLRARDRVIGVIELINAMDERPFNSEDVLILEAFADFAAIAIDNARLHGELIEVTRNDPLSGLRNSRYFLACLDDAVHRGQPFAILFADMDRFKTLVDRHGHMNGSAALAEVGGVYGAALGPEEVGCRFGGDEFAFILPGADGARARTRCEELAALVREGTFLVEEGISARLDVSFGWAAFPDDAITGRVLLHRADSRMYESKRARKMARSD